jgi:hypothetical protein
MGCGAWAWVCCSFGYNILRRNQTRTFSQDRYAAALAGIDALSKWSVS